MSVRLHIDSQHTRPGNNTKGSYTFDLSEGFTVRSVQVLHVVVANTFYNIPGQIAVPVSNGSGQTDTMEIKAGFYQPPDLADIIRLGLGNVVQAVNEKLVWTLGIIEIDGGDLGIPALGLPPGVSTGSFESTPIFTPVSCVGICIRELDAVFCVTTGTVPCRPTVIVPLTNGHGMFEVYEPKQPQTYKCNVQQLSSLTVEIRDMATGLILDSAGSFSIEILCN
jgi:hypothetical protein